ncbi:MAG: hypothetical protein PF501_02985 [Salinisphaera sp.]|nr:hypothetical protein [Salinisphaera sp.]
MTTSGDVKLGVWLVLLESRSAARCITSHRAVIVEKSFAKPEALLLFNRLAEDTISLGNEIAWLASSRLEKIEAI